MRHFRLLISLMAALLFAVPAFATPWARTGNTETYSWTTVADPDDAADLSFCETNHAAMTINRDFGSNVGENNQAGGAVYQCQGASDTIGSAGCSTAPVRRWITNVGPAITGYDTFLDLNRGKYFRLDVITARGGAGSATVSITCTGTPAPGKVLLISEIVHGNLSTSGTEFKLEPNPHRAGLYFWNMPTSGSPYYVFSEEGGLGAFASSTSTKLGITVNPGEMVQVPGNSPLVFGAATGTNGGHARVLEAVALNGVAPLIADSNRRSANPTPSFTGYASTAVDATFAISADHIFFIQGAKKITCNADTGNTAAVRVGSLTVNPTSGNGFALLPGGQLVIEWPLFQPAFISDTGTQEVSCFAEMW